MINEILTQDNIELGKLGFYTIISVIMTIKLINKIMGLGTYDR